MSGGCSSTDAARDAEAIEYYCNAAIERDKAQAEHSKGVASRREARKRKKIADNKAVKRNKADVAEANRMEARARCVDCQPGVACEHHQKNAEMTQAYLKKWPQVLPAAPLVPAVEPQVLPAAPLVPAVEPQVLPAAPLVPVVNEEMRRVRAKLQEHLEELAECNRNYAMDQCIHCRIGKRCIHDTRVGTTSTCRACPKHVHLPALSAAYSRAYPHLYQGGDRYCPYSGRLEGMKKTVRLCHDIYKAPNQSSFDDNCFDLAGSVPAVLLPPVVVAHIVLIHFETTRFTTVHSRNFANDGTVSFVIKYVASQMGVQAHRIQLRSEHERHGAWFLLDYEETIRDMGQYVKCIRRDMPLGIPVYQLRIALINPYVEDAPDTGAPQHGVGVGGVGC